jgi:hypothetical protein
LKLLLDHNLSPRIARSLQALFDQHEIVALRDKFSGNTPDPEWIEALDRERGWAVLTMDLRIRTRPHERAALDRTAIVYFFLSGSWRKLKIEEQAWCLIRLMPKMAQQTEIAERAVDLSCRSTPNQSCVPTEIEMIRDRANQASIIGPLRCLLELRVAGVLRLMRPSGNPVQSRHFRYPAWRNHAIASERASR